MTGAKQTPPDWLIELSDKLENIATSRPAVAFNEDDRDNQDEVRGGKSKGW